MAGKKFGVVMLEKVPATYHQMPKAEQEKAGSQVGALLAKYQGKVEMVRRYWTSAFDAEITDVFIIECDNPADFHDFNQELTEVMAEGGDPERYGRTVKVLLGVNPDSD